MPGDGREGTVCCLAGKSVGQVFIDVGSEKSVAEQVSVKPWKG